MAFVHVVLRFGVRVTARKPPADSLVELGRRSDLGLLLTNVELIRGFQFQVAQPQVFFRNQRLILSPFHGGQFFRLSLRIQLLSFVSFIPQPRVNVKHTQQHNQRNAR